MVHTCPKGKVQGWDSNLYPRLNPNSFLFSHTRAQANAVWLNPCSSWPQLLLPVPRCTGGFCG